MKVYVVTEAIDGKDIVGIYDTEEKAQNRIIQRVKDDSTSVSIYNDIVADGYFHGTIEEWVKEGYVSDYWWIEKWEVE